jgi:hypothetical protein
MPCERHWQEKVKPGFIHNGNAWYDSAMNGGPRIIPIEPGQPDTGRAKDVLELGEAAAADQSPSATYGYEEETETISARGEWIGAFLVGLAIAGWSGFHAWANLPLFLEGGTPGDWSQWIVAWSVPTLLCLVIVLVMMRTSRREGSRFADVARTLATESRHLEDRLRSVNSELSLARDFIAAQSRDLESLGRIAVERLSGSASQLADLVGKNGDRVDSIATVASSALENMEKLRGQLPVIANAAKDVTNNIANAGRTAHVQLEDMANGFQRLNEFGLASERQVEKIRESVSAAVEELARRADQLGEIADARFAALTSESEVHRQRLDQEEIAALAAIRGRAAALGEELATHRAAAETAEAEALDALRARLASLREESARVAGEIATGEAHALAGWTERAATHASSLREALTALDADHRESVEAGTARFARFTQEAGTLVERLRGELDALEGDFARRRELSDSEARQRADALSARLAEIDREIAARRDANEAAALDAAEALNQRLAELELIVAQHQERQFLRAREVAEHCVAIGERVKAFSATIEQAGAQGEQTGRAVESAMVLLSDKLVASREALTGTDRQVADLTDASVRLLELIQASSDHSKTHIPQALGAAEAGLRGIEDRVFTLRDTLAQAGDGGRSLSDYVIQTRHEVGAAMGDMARLQDELGERTLAQEHRIAALREALTAVRTESAGLAQEIEGNLQTAIAQLADAARKAGEELDGTASQRIEALAGRLGEDSSAAIARVIETQAAELVGGIERAVTRAAESSREASIQLRDQLAKVDELAGNLETRVARARERAQEQVDSDFARRVALITESLNSTAIDIAKVMSSDVTDTAWAAYLRGDRGIFTRRAVSLLDASEARAVLQHYERDPEFREHVNHYIHDFEAMLRQLLSTRDGNALGVTLLSSDMGKLYVALAQAIERLRA